MKVQRIRIRDDRTLVVLYPVQVVHLLYLLYVMTCLDTAMPVNPWCISETDRTLFCSV